MIDRTSAPAKPCHVAPARRLVAILVLAGAVTSSGATAETGSPVVVAGLGPKEVRVEIAAGGTAPCDASDNVRLYLGPLKPGVALRLWSPSLPVCFRQTYDNFPDVNWSASSLYGPPMICAGIGKARRCVPAPDPTIRITVRSPEP